MLLTLNIVQADPPKSFEDKGSFGLMGILEEKKNELSPHSKNSPFFLQNSFNPKKP
jgi:hypothetical protein